MFGSVLSGFPDIDEGHRTACQLFFKGFGSDGFHSFSTPSVRQVDDLAHSSTKYGGEKVEV